MKTAAPQQSYKPEIDGLRGIAVLAVLLFHAGVPFFNGGFIGVDVFFVISGYLITGIVISAHKSGSFSFSSFMARRFFRLYPALIVSVLLTLFVGYLVLSPAHLESLGSYSALSLLSASNILFYNVAGYFAESSEVNPLLHTWSLGVEQQFYLIWPAIVIACYRFLGRRAGVAIGLIVCLFLAGSEYGVNENPDAAYFLTHYRVFEFGIGALLCFGEKLRDLPNLVKEGLLGLGLLIVGFCIYAYDSSIPFPGVSALLPCAGAALCILFGDARLFGTIVRNKAIVWVGVISYSLYLVHWPIVVYVKYYVFVEPSYTQKALMVSMAFLLAYPLYKLVEVPNRRLKFSFENPSRSVAVGLSLVLVFAASSATFFSGGAKWRIDGAGGDSSLYAGSQFKNMSVLGDDSQTVSLILIGDSFAGNLAGGLDAMLKANNKKAISLWSSGCLISRNFRTFENGKPKTQCDELSKKAIQLIGQYDVPVILAQSWGGPYSKNTVDASGSLIRFKDRPDYVRFLYENSQDIKLVVGPNRKMLIVGSTPGDGRKGGASIRSCIERPAIARSACEKMFAFDEVSGFAYQENHMLSAMVTRNSGVYLDPYTVFCSSGRCSGVIGSDSAYSDFAHLSMAGSKKLVEYFEKEILKTTSSSRASL